MGTRPVSWSVPRAPSITAVFADKSKMATAFAAASVTNNRARSADSATLLGVLPCAGPDGGASGNSATNSPFATSRTLTRSVLPLVTESRDPFVDTSIDEGRRAVFHYAGVADNPMVIGVNASTCDALHTLTITRPFRVTTIR